MRTNYIPLIYSLLIHVNIKPDRCGLLPLGLDLTLRLKGKEIIPEDGEVVITDLPVGGCRRYDSLECLSDVQYRGRVENAYWEYTDPYTLITQRVDTIRCKDDECNSTDIGWWSARGIYKKGKKYYGVVRLGRHFENARWGLLTCVFEEKTVSVTIGECDIIAMLFYLRTLTLIATCIQIM